MSSSVEAISVEDTMKLALEALESGLDYAENENFENKLKFRGYEHLMPTDAAESVEQIKTAITALRQAIAAAELHKQAQKQEPDVSNKLHFDCEFVDGTCADLTVYGSERDIKRLEARIKFWWNLEQHSGTPDSDKAERIIWSKPPQRPVAQPHKPLTDEQITSVWETRPYFNDFARAIEAAHGISKGEA